MSASSRPTRKPRSRKPSARLIAVVDFPTPPLPEATAMTAAMPGISACFDIGDAGPCCGRCDETGGAPWACRWARRGGDAGNGTRGRFGLRPDALPGAALGGIDIDRKKPLAVANRYRRQHIGIGQR